jgi:zinc D-Ala-D-Ala carboxypeptidase
MSRIPRILVAGLLAVIAAVVAANGHALLTSSSSTAAPPPDGPRGKLDPALRGAVRQAAADAAGDGVEFFVESGWRSPEHQEQLLREAVSKYGSEEEAARWVATADTSPHVSGDAVDIGPSAGTAWLSEHGAEYGLCQIYGNEPWHYELRPEAIDQGCPPMYADPTHDPRMQR